MTQNQVLVIVAVSVVIAAALIVLVVLRVRRRRRLAAMSPEERELLEAERHWREAVQRAEKTLEKTQREWEERVREAERSLEEARRIGYRPLGSFDKVELYEDHLETPEGSFQLGNGPVEALVETAEQLSATRQDVLSRISKELLRDLLAQAGGDKSPTYYLVVVTPIFVSIRSVRESDVTRARQFATSINSAASSTAELARRREEAVLQAQQRLDQARADREAAVAAAERELETVKANTARLDAARKAVDALRAQTTVQASPGDGGSVAQEERTKE